MKIQVKNYYFCLLMIVAEKIVNGQYYSKCVQPEEISFIREPILINNCDTVAYGSIMCNKMHGCDMYEKTGNTCIFYRSNVGCNEIGEQNKRMFKKLTCKAGWSPKNEICYLQTTEQKYCQDAQNACLSIGGNPAEFYSKEDMTHALTVITSNVYVSGSLQGGVFIWNVSGQQIDSSLWIPNEPAGGTCVQIWRDKKGLDALEDTHVVTVLCEQRLFRWV